MTASSAQQARHLGAVRWWLIVVAALIVVMVLVVVWSLLGMTIAQTPWLAASGLLQAIFYVVAGIGWVLPAMPIISWMSRPDRAA